MVKPTGCARWKVLFEDTANRGKIYDDFLADRYLLTDHLYYCEDCQKLTYALDPDPDIMPDNSITDEEFAQSIRELYRLYKEKNQIP